MKEGQSEIKKSIMRRVRWLYLWFSLAGVLIIGGIVATQYGPRSEELKKKSVRITYERVKLEADRGDILAHDGRILATSIPMYEIRMDFAAQGIVDSIFNKNVGPLSENLAWIFKDKSAAAYKSMLAKYRSAPKKNRYVLISPRRVNFLELQDIKKFPLYRLGTNKSGLITVQVNKRIMPHGSLAARTVGMVNDDGVRVGVEGAFDKELRGVEGNTMMQKISGSFRVPVRDELAVEPIDGMDVVTTLDVDIQDVAETALKAQLDAGEADWGSVVLMEVATGEIRAMSNITRKRSGVFTEEFNYAVGMNLEPGSTFKLAVLMTLLDNAGASLDEMYDTGDGKVMVGKVKVIDSHACGKVTLSEVFEHSSNVGFALAVNKYYKDKPKRFVDHINNMGLGLPMNVQIAGEPKYIIHYPGKPGWDGTTLTMMSYGYALRVTPLKTLSFYNAVANGGVMMRPLLVKELRQYGQTLRTYQPQTMGKPIATDKTLKKVQDALNKVVEDGTAKVLKNPYYSVAGKTGTAQIAQGRHGYTDSRGGRHYLATLVGYFPADKPRYSCIVVMKTYKGPNSRNTYYGASLAGPVFRAIADRVYASSTEWQMPVSKTRPAIEGKYPVIKYGEAAEYRYVARRFDAPFPGRDHKGWIGMGKPADSLSRDSFRDIVAVEGVVPDVTGMGLKEALYLLESAGLKVIIYGKGSVYAQSLKAGTSVPRGESIAITLRRTAGGRAVSL